ncbi:hypothetical protein CC85DRAFT_304038 [Cutaneotrichosporon oleaginosum]|uniref:Uncharacterized protein n=1 Tax=Cutaneotrichosporon oleaginosum TaxID=879819 RepID=A0A0J0XHH0_9TREE|nr:uncharacterized protein CC85DRAFT_304038 [Cutaneotrichosporon oleaginosum]KLT40508.1 hypothetical protein CC85DRAFT_304038 [Cutaneotrichosporon oleaginosum]TXT08420.1 hypothetical protein COLE_05344 [Cutaneotrichosporon oleaginosum]
MFDHTAYPHIMEAILSHASPDVLRAIGLTSRHFLSVTDKLLDSQTLTLSLLPWRPSPCRSLLGPCGGRPDTADTEIVLCGHGWMVRAAGLRALHHTRAIDANADVEWGLQMVWSLFFWLLPRAAVRGGPAVLHCAADEVIVAFDGHTALEPRYTQYSHKRVVVRYEGAGGESTGRRSTVRVLSTEECQAEIGDEQYAIETAW